jgi:ribonuclease-3
LADLEALQKNLGVFFKDSSLLEQALVHSSYVNENSGVAQISNERLEFLGDAVLGLVVAGELYQSLPDSDEGEMTRYRAALVCRDALVSVARTVNLGDYLYMGRGEEVGGGRDKQANLARALEAVIAAIFLDGGWVAARDFVLRLFNAELERLISQGVVADYKSQLQELAQARGQRAPVYHLVEAVGPDHDKSFVVEVEVANAILGRGSGKTKKAAETEAARVALEQLSTSFT